jgi:hypothetical protein
MANKKQAAQRAQQVAAARKAGAPPPPAKVRNNIYTPEDGVAWQRIAKKAQGYGANSKLHSCPVPEVLETYLVTKLHLRKNTKGQYKPVGIAVARTPTGVHFMLTKSKKAAVSRFRTPISHLRHRPLFLLPTHSFYLPLRAAARRQPLHGQGRGQRGAVRRAGGHLRQPLQDLALHLQAL